MGRRKSQARMKVKGMSKIRKVRCPHCNKVNSIDVDQELETSTQLIIRRGVGGDVEKPKTISVKCRYCGEAFKVNR